MTSFWLFLSKMFLASYKFYDAFAYELNWVLFIVGSGFFLYWCSVLIFELGGHKDKTYYSSTEGKFPYYDPKYYSKKED